MAAKKTPVAARATSTLPINYEEQMANEAAEIAKRIAAPSGDRIRGNSNRGFITPDGMEGEELEVIILDFVSANLFYDRPYNKDAPEVAACFAIGSEPSTLEASDNSPDKQSDSCNICPLNVFGSALTGKGKACKNTRQIAITPANDLTADSPVWVFSVSPGALKAYDSYVSSLAGKHKTSPVGVVTKMTMDQNVTYSSPKFEVVRPITPEEFQVAMSLREEARKRLLVEPDVSGYTPPAPVKKGRTR